MISRCGPPAHKTAVKVVAGAVIAATVVAGVVTAGASEAAVPEEVGGAAALETAADAEAEEATAGELKYSDRVEARSAEEPGPNHNFPRSFDREIMQNGQRTVGRNGYEQFNLRGSINGREGTYELGTQNGEVTHRFFRPD
jgi:hypothetical protein